jgi:hypothetical protein
MDTTRIAVIAATSAVVSWALKGVAIWAAGGPGTSPLEGPLFFIGLVCFVVAVCSFALSVVGRPEWWAKGATVAGAVITVAVFAAVSGLAVDQLATTAHWVWGEITLWLPALAVLAGSTWYASRQPVRTA